MSRPRMSAVPTPRPDLNSLTRTARALKEQLDQVYRELDILATLEVSGGTGTVGPQGPAGSDGEGVPAGGTSGQVLEKIDATDYNTQWATPSGGGSTAWGGITGTLSDQTDLQNSLNGKAASAHTHTESEISDLGTYEPAFAKNTAFNKNYGSTLDTVCQGNDSRLSDARTPTAHTHTESEITDLGNYSTVGHTHTESEITDLDAYLTDAPSNGSEYVRKDGNWAVSTGGGGGATQLSELTDVNTSTPANRNALVADGTDWESRPLVEADISDLGTYEPAFSKNTGFNKNLGTTAGTVCEGNDSRLSDARTPTAHTHTESEITDLGNYEPAFSKNTGFNKNLGTTAGTVCEGNDSRLSDARAPTAHTHTESEITDLGNYEPAFSKNTAFNKSFGAVVDTVCQGNDSRLSDARTPTAHTHTESEITDLGNYSTVGHTHTESEITDLGSYLTDAPSNGSEYVRKDGAWAIASAAGGGVDLKPYAVVDSTGGQTLDSTNGVTVNLDSVQVSNGNYSLASDEITISTAGTYWIAFGVQINMNANITGTRGGWESYIEYDATGVGSSYARVPQLSNANYWREQSSECSTGGSGVVVVAAGGLIRLRTQHTFIITTAPWPLTANRSYVSIIKVA